MEAGEVVREGRMPASMGVPLTISFYGLCLVLNRGDPPRQV